MGETRTEVGKHVVKCVNVVQGQTTVCAVEDVGEVEDERLRQARRRPQAARPADGCPAVDVEVADGGGAERLRPLLHCAHDGAELGGVDVGGVGRGPRGREVLVERVVDGGEAVRAGVGGDGVRLGGRRESLERPGHNGGAGRRGVGVGRARGSGRG